jgi:hypothetical protein
MATIHFPPDFFVKEAKQEYSDVWMRLISELVQNSVDAGAKKVQLIFTPDRYCCEDDGIGMSADRMVEAMLTMGGSVKGTGATGGFGAAKKLLLFAQDIYNIHSLDTYVEGRGLEYHFKDCMARTGTLVRGYYSDAFKKNGENMEAYMTAKAKAFLEMCNFPNVKIFLNGELFTGYLTRPQSRVIDGLGTLFAAKKGEGTTYGRLFVRHNGMYMFTKWIDNLDRHVILEVNGDSKEVFTQNRDGFRGEYSTRADKLVSELAIDKKSALNKPSQRNYVIRGKDKSITVNALATMVPQTVLDYVTKLSVTPNSPVTASMWANALTTVPENVKKENQSAISIITEMFSQKGAEADFHFDLADSEYNKVPWWFVPNTGKAKFTNLARLWKVCVVETLKANNISQSFALGFTFASNAQATHRMLGGVTIYHLNPACDAFRKNKGQKLVMEMLTTAVHEVVHSLGHRYHDESFVRKLHDLLTPTLVNAPSWRQLVKMAKSETV